MAENLEEDLIYCLRMLTIDGTLTYWFQKHLQQTKPDKTLNLRLSETLAAKEAGTAI